MQQAIQDVLPGLVRKAVAAAVEEEVEGVKAHLEKKMKRVVEDQVGGDCEQSGGVIPLQG